MKEVPKEEFTKTVNEVAREVYSKTENFETLARETKSYMYTGDPFKDTLARETYDALSKDYAFYTERPDKVKKTIQEQITLPDGRVVSVPKEVEEWVMKRRYWSIRQIVRGKLNPIGSLSRFIDYSSLPTKEKYMPLLEYLDRTGQHVSRKFSERYRDEQRSFAKWDALFRWLL